MSGETRPAQAFTQQNGRTLVPLELPPGGSIFVVLRKAIAADVNGTAGSNFRTLRAAGELAGPWRVTFPPGWGAPESAEFEKLVSWPDRSEPGIRAFSGKATYHKTFDLSGGVDPAKQQVLLELGQVAVIAQVRLNGKDLGVLWTAPFRCDVTAVVKPVGNELEIDVVNGWLNRVLADQDLPAGKRFTRTNIVLARDRKPMESGLIGPVRVMVGM
ncbi:MAG: glycosylhydrolase-like jelly roll fold domain-containing protein [Tepidisphaeraceae bacterium]